MKNSKVVNIKLGTPPKGARTIVWSEGSKERSMIVRSAEDWSVRIAYEEDDGGAVTTFCVSSSPDDSEMSVTKLKAGERPKTLKMSKDDISKRLSSPPSKMSAAEIARALDGYIDPGEPIRPTRPGQ